MNDDHNGRLMAHRERNPLLGGILAPDVAVRVFWNTNMRGPPFGMACLLPNWSTDLMVVEKNIYPENGAVMTLGTSEIPVGNGNDIIMNVVKVHITVRGELS